MVVVSTDVNAVRESQISVWLNSVSVVSFCRAAVCISRSAIHAHFRIETVNRTSSGVLAPDHTLKFHHRRHRAQVLRSSVGYCRHTSVHWSRPAEGPCTMSSSFIADEVLALELADADITAFLPSREQLALWPPHFKNAVFPKSPISPDLIRPYSK